MGGRTGIQRKILFGLGGVVVLLGLGVIIFVKTVLYEELLLKLEKRGISIARHMAATSINPMLTEKFFELEMIAKDFMKSEEGIEYIFVLDRGGNVSVHTFERGFPVELRGVNTDFSGLDYSIRKIITEKGSILDVAVPLMKGEAGSIHLGFSERHIRKEIDTILRLTAGLIAAILFLGYGVSVLLSRIIVKPVLELARVAEAVGNGDLEHRVDVHTDDEIGRLCEIFNDMIHKRKVAESEREALIAQLQGAMKEIKTLSGLLPICAWCKKIRDDQGYWKNVEVYFREHSDTEFSHGICPDCANKILNDELKDV